MWLLSVVCGPDTNVVIPLGPATEDWILYSGAGINHSCLLGRGGVTRSAELWCSRGRGVTGQPWHGALPCSWEQVAFAKLADWQLQVAEIKTSLTLCLKEQKQPSIFRSREGSNSCPAHVGGFGY